MKKYYVVLPILALSAIILTGCSKKDQNYYDTHLDIAKDKLQSCEKEIKQAWEDSDEAKLKKIDADQDCNFAFNAVRDAKALERKAEQKTDTFKF